MNQKLQDIIDTSTSIVFFGGAGVSTESGIPDFRSTDGLYHQTYQYPPETILSHSFFEQHTKEFFDFYKEKMICLDAKPNAAHFFLAGLEQCGKLKAVVTQNIDGLHQAAGSKNVLELHGSVHRNTCLECGKKYGIQPVLEAQEIPLCCCGGVIKPDVVLYEEPLDGEVIKQSVAAIAAADTLIVGGTSLNVYPAAGLLRYFTGRHLVLINKSATSADQKAQLVLREPIGQVFGELKTESR